MLVSMGVSRVVLFSIVAFSAVVVAREAYAVYTAVSLGREAIAHASAYERIDADAMYTLLLLGDSTGVGVGASSPEHSIAGRIAHDVPMLSIENRSESGKRIAELTQELSMLEPDAPYDLLFLMIGGNDILRFTTRKAFRASLREAFAQAARHADSVVLLSAGNVGHAPAWAPFLSRVFEIRSRRMREILLEEVARAEVIFVDVFVAEREQDPFALDPARYHAPDGLHPSSEGYALWYERWKQRWRAEDHWLGAWYREML